MCYSATYPIYLLPISHRGGDFGPTNQQVTDIR